MAVQYTIRADARQAKAELSSLKSKEAKLEQQTIRTKQGFDKLSTSALRNENALRRTKLATQKLDAAELKLASSTNVATAGMVNQRRVTSGLIARVGALRNQILLYSFATTGLFLAIRKLVSESSKLKESINAIGVVFGTAREQLLEFGETADRSVGLSASAFNQLATVTGALIKGIGLPMKEVAELTIQLTKRAADMASVYDFDVSVALNAINSALRGQNEPITRFAVNTQIAELRAVALAKGIDKSVDAMSQQEKRLLVIDAIMQQTADTEGDFTKTQKDFANATRTLTSRLNNMAASVGDDLLPPLERLIDVLNRITVEGGPLEKFGTRMQDIGKRFALVNPAVKLYLDFLGVLDEKTEDAIDPMDRLLQSFKELNEELDRQRSSVTDFITESIVEQNKATLRLNFLTGQTVEMIKTRNAFWQEGNGITERELTLKLQIMGITREEFELAKELRELQSDKVLLEQASLALTTRKLEFVKVMTLEEGLQAAWLKEQGVTIPKIEKGMERAAIAAASMAASLATSAIFGDDLEATLKTLFRQGLNLLLTQNFGGAPGFAHGTNFAPGGPAIVGERGPELVNLPRGSQVIPNNQITNNNNSVNFNMPNVKSFDKFTIETQVMPLIRQSRAEGEL